MFVNPFICLFFVAFFSLRSQKNWKPNVILEKLFQQINTNKIKISPTAHLSGYNIITVCAKKTNWHRPTITTTTLGTTNNNGQQRQLRQRRRRVYCWPKWSLAQHSFAEKAFIHDPPLFFACFPLYNQGFGACTTKYTPKSIKFFYFSMIIIFFCYFALLAITKLSQSKRC